MSLLDTIFGPINPNAKVGTTSPYFVPRASGPVPVKPGEYFLIKIHSSQANFRASFFDTPRQLVVTSKVNLNHASLGNEPVFAIQRARVVRKNQPEQLGLAENLVSLVPANMSNVSFTIDFLVDAENNLGKMVKLINTDEFTTAVSFAPGAAAAAKTIGGLAQKVIQTFIPEQQQQPILQFSGAFNIGEGDGALQDGYYVILGTRDPSMPLPDPMPKLRVENNALVADGPGVSSLSYVVLEVTRSPARTRRLHAGAPWEAKLQEAEAKAQDIADDPFADNDAKKKVYEECKTLLQEARTLIRADANYSPEEATAIVSVALKQCTDKIKGALESLEVDTPIAKGDLTDLGIDEDADLDKIVDDYERQEQEANGILKASKLL